MAFSSRRIARTIRADADIGQLIIAPDLKETLAKVDQFEVDSLKKIDDYIVRVGLCAPPETIPQLHDGYEQEVITELNLEASEISTILWAIGYSFDFCMVKLPVVDADGYPRQARGVTEYEGLYFLGMPWLHTRRSGILFGVGDDAAYLAAHIAAHDERPYEVGYPPTGHGREMQFIDRVPEDYARTF